jgi:cytochrome P450
MSALPSGPRGFLRVNWQLMRDPIGTALRWRSQYGDPMTYPDLEGKPCLSIGSPEGISSLLSAPLEATEQALVERLSAFLGESSVLTISGPRHAAMRKLLTPPFHGQRMRVYGKQICDLTMDHARKLPPGLKFKPLDFINGIGLEVIVRLIFGVTAPERVALVETLVADMRKAFPRAIIPMLIPWLRRELWGFGPWARMQATLRAVSGFLKEEIANHRAHPTEQSDILSLLIAARHEDGSGLTDQEIIDQLHTLLFAGHSTTAMALNWALYFLLKEPQSLARLRKELTELGSNPSPELLAKAPFLDDWCFLLSLGGRDDRMRGCRLGRRRRVRMCFGRGRSFAERDWLLPVSTSCCIGRVTGCFLMRILRICLPRLGVTVCLLVSSLW